jgi:UDP-N-acetylmuramate--alanine ligase
MSAIASVLVAMGHRVSGSDAAASPLLDRLRDMGVVTHAGHDPAAVDGVDAVVVSSAIPPDDPEVKSARALGIPVTRRADALAAIAEQRQTIAVSGTHGKTTTTAMLTVVLRGAGLAPSYIVGAEIAGLGRAAAWDAGEWFVVEADESDGTFLELPARAVLVTIPAGCLRAVPLPRRGSAHRLRR